MQDFLDWMDRQKQEGAMRQDSQPSPGALPPNSGINPKILEALHNANNFLDNGDATLGRNINFIKSKFGDLATNTKDAISNNGLADIISQGQQEVGNMDPSLGFPGKLGAALKTGAKGMMYGLGAGTVGAAKQPIKFLVGAGVLPKSFVDALDPSATQDVINQSTNAVADVVAQTKAAAAKLNADLNPETLDVTKVIEAAKGSGKTPYFKAGPDTKVISKGSYSKYKAPTNTNPMTQSFKNMGFDESTAQSLTQSVKSMDKATVKKTTDSSGKTTTESVKNPAASGQTFLSLIQQLQEARLKDKALNVDPFGGKGSVLARVAIVDEALKTAKGPYKKQLQDYRAQISGIPLDTSKE